MMDIRRAVSWPEDGDNVRPMNETELKHWRHTSPNGRKMPDWIVPCILTTPKGDEWIVFRRRDEL